MKHHPIRGASSADEAYVRRCVEHCRRHHQHVLGFYYDDQLGSWRGIDITLFVPPGTHPQTSDKAILELKAARDVEASTVLMVPEEWLDPITETV